MNDVRFKIWVGHLWESVVKETRDLPKIQRVQFFTISRGRKFGLGFLHPQTVYLSRRFYRRFKTVKTWTGI